MPLQTMQSDGGLGDINNLLNLVKDQKTTSSTTSNLTDAGVQTQINNILSGNQGLAAVAGAQHSAGFYDSSVNTQLVNDLLTRTAAQVQAQKAGTTTTTAKKAPISSQQALTTLAGLALKNPGKLKSLYQTLTTKGATSADVDKVLADQSLTANTNDAAGFANLEDGAASGAGGGGSDLAAGVSSTNATDTLANALDTAGFTEQAGATSADVTNALASTTATNSNDVAGLQSLDSAAAGAGAGSAAAESASFDAGTSAGLAGTEADFGLGASDAAGAGAGETAGVGAGELGGSAVAGWGALAVASALDANATQTGSSSNAKGFLDYTGDIGTSDVIRGLDSGNITDSVNPIGQGIINAVGLTGAANDVGKATGWIICTELVNQGRMPRKYYVPGLRVFQSYRLDLLNGYYVWARPTVALLKAKPLCLRSRFVSWLFNHRAEYLASRVSVAGARNTVIGATVSHIVYGFCWILGQYLLHTRSPKEGEFV